MSHHFLICGPQVSSSPALAIAGHCNIMLDPYIISQTHTIEQIDAQIVSIKAVYDNAIKNRTYQLDDGHARQRVEQHEIDKISSELNVWLKAKAILTGTQETKLYAIDYQGNNN